MTQSIIYLGYHSPTEWVFVPETLALYRHIYINEDAYERAISRKSSSGYLNRKKEILEELRDRGVLNPIPYRIEEEKKGKLEGLLDYFFETHQDDIRALSIGAFNGFIAHEEGTLQNLVSAEDPYWNDVMNQLPRLRSSRDELRKGRPLREFEFLKKVIGPYFEDVLFSPLVSHEDYNPVFHWEGYAPFEEWILKMRRDHQEARNRIEKGSQLKVLTSLSEIVVPFSPITTVEDVSKITEGWTDFDSTRKLAKEANDSIWKEINAAALLSPNQFSEFTNDFESSLRIRCERISKELRQATEERRKAKTRMTYKVIRFVAASLGSVPFVGGAVSHALDEMVAFYVENKSIKGPSAIKCLLEYERNMSKLALSREPIPPVCKIHENYESISYWDSETIG